MRVAFYGRVSTDDAQDPSLSIPRQLGKCDEALAPIGERVTLTFWDVESGRKALEDRGNGKRDWTAEVDVPRVGGLPELLRSTQEGEVDAVIVESIDRLSRMTADGTRIERELEERDVALFAADEPLNSSATAILTRRVKQGVAEWYVRDLIERSRAGMEESVRQGWHTGGPAPYGYVLDPHPHPNPQKAREGRKKHRLIVDTVRGPIVLMIFAWYVEEALGLGTICERLNSDLDRYPPPKRNRKDENDLPQTWSKSQLHSLLRNPKYTGFNVWGRHDKRKGRPVMRPRDKWVWSATPDPRGDRPPRAVRRGRGTREAQRQLHSLTKTEALPTAACGSSRSPLRAARSDALRPLRTADGGQPPEGLQLVPLPIRDQARRGGGRRGRPPACARHQGGRGAGRPARLHVRAAVRT